MRAKVQCGLRRLLPSETGSTAIEYSLIAAFIAAVIVGGVAATGTEVQALFDKVATLMPS